MNHHATFHPTKNPQNRDKKHATLANRVVFFSKKNTHLEVGSKQGIEVVQKFETHTHTQTQLGFISCEGFCLVFFWVPYFFLLMGGS